MGYWVYINDNPVSPTTSWPSSSSPTNTSSVWLGYAYSFSEEEELFIPYIKKKYRRSFAAKNVPWRINPVVKLRDKRAAKRYRREPHIRVFDYERRVKCRE